MSDFNKQYAKALEKLNEIAQISVENKVLVIEVLDLLDLALRELRDGLR